MHNNESKVFTVCQKFDWMWETKKCIQNVGRAIFLKDRTWTGYEDKLVKLGNVCMGGGGERRIQGFGGET